MVEKNEKLVIVTEWIKGLNTVEVDDICSQYMDDIEEGLRVEFTPYLMECPHCKQQYRFDDLEYCPKCDIEMEYANDDELFFFPNKLYYVEAENWIWEHRIELANLGFRIYETLDYGTLFGINGEDGEFLENSWLPFFELYHRHATTPKVIINEPVRASDRERASAKIWLDRINHIQGFLFDKAYATEIAEGQPFEINHFGYTFDDVFPQYLFVMPNIPHLVHHHEKDIIKLGFRVFHVEKIGYMVSPFACEGDFFEQRWLPLHRLLYGKHPLDE